MQTNEMLIVLVTCPPDQATCLADLIIIEKLAACVNIMPINSVYSWENEIKHDDEKLLIIKTTTGAYPKLETRLTEIHPYNVPEIVAIKAESVWDGYLKWVIEQTRPAND
jgi:periplasmic divalent cation tolerance protein